MNSNNCRQCHLPLHKCICRVGAGSDAERAPKCQCGHYRESHDTQHPYECFAETAQDQQCPCERFALVTYPEHPSIALETAWQEYMKLYAPIHPENREWEAFKFGWDKAMTVAREAMADN